MTDRIINPENIGELAKALALARVQFPDIPKNKTVRVSKQGKLQYTFDFADLASIFAATKQALSDNGIAVIQQPTNADGKFVLETIIAHESGAAIIGHHPLPEYLQVNSKTDLNAAMQSMGSAIKFARRYAVSAVLGIDPHDDDDANIADGNDYHQNNRGYQGGDNPSLPPQEDAVSSHAAKGCFACASTLRIPDDVFTETLYEKFKVKSKKDITLDDWESLLAGLKRIVEVVTDAAAEMAGLQVTCYRTSDQGDDLKKAVEQFVIYLNETDGDWKAKAAALRKSEVKAAIFESFGRWKIEQAEIDRHEAADAK